jgi:hypothetical protein
MTDEIVVPQLCVHVATGPTCYPLEAGYSAIIAEIETRDKSLIEILSIARSECRTITLRCAMLEVVGIVTKITPEDGMLKIVLAVEDLHYRKSTATTVIVERLHR